MGPGRTNITVATIPPEVVHPVAVYVPPHARGHRTGTRTRSLAETCRTQASRANPAVPHCTSVRVVDLPKKQDIHLFGSMAYALKNGSGCNEQFSVAVLANYVDQCTAFMHVHRFELNMNSYLGLCAFWVRGALDNMDPSIDTPAEFTQNTVVQRAKSSVLGLINVQSIPDEDREAFVVLDEAFTLLSTMLRTDAADIKNNAVVPDQIPLKWQTSLELNQIVNGLNVSAIESDTDTHFGHRLGKFYTATAALRKRTNLLPTHLDILSRLDAKAQLQYAKLTTARGILVPGFDIA